jgi:hypothetical protein
MPLSVREIFVAVAIGRKRKAVSEGEERFLFLDFVVLVTPNLHSTLRNLLRGLKNKEVELVPNASPLNARTARKKTFCNLSL